MWQELIEVLRQLQREYESLRSLGKEKHGMLISVNLERVEAILKKEEVHSARIAELEGQRKAILMKLAGLEKNLRPDMKMAELYHVVPNPRTRQTLKELHGKLDEAVEAVVQQNEINSVLVHGALNAVNAKLNRLGGVSVEPAYGKGGKDVVSHRRNFDFRA